MALTDTGYPLHIWVGKRQRLTFPATHDTRIHVLAFADYVLHHNGDLIAWAKEPYNMWISTDAGKNWTKLDPTPIPYTPTYPEPIEHC